MTRSPFSPRRYAAAAVLAACAVGACAQPADAPLPPAPEGRDGLLQLLGDRGLLSTDVVPASVVRRVRDAASELVVAALNFLDVPYRRGGNGAGEGFDCSGFTRHIFATSAGLVLPRRVDDQAHASGVTPIARDELKPGDLVFFNTLQRTFSHVGIYIGEGRFIHAPRSGAEVRIEDMRMAYWRKRFTGARRVDAIHTSDGQP